MLGLPSTVPVQPTATSLGGTFERGEASLDVNAEAERWIVEGHRRLFAGMRTL